MSTATSLPIKAAAAGPSADASEDTTVETLTAKSSVPGSALLDITAEGNVAESSTDTTANASIDVTADSTVDTTPADDEEVRPDDDYEDDDDEYETEEEETVFSKRATLSYISDKSKVSINHPLRCADFLVCPGLSIVGISSRTTGLIHSPLCTHQTH